MTARNEPATREELIRAYDILVGGMEEEAHEDEDRAYGGIVRAAKKKVTEQMASHIVQLAWLENDGDPRRLSIGDRKSYSVAIQPGYVERLPKDIRDYINARLDGYTYQAQVDRHIFVDREFVLGIECKAYAEIAMLKRILVDFRILRSIHPNLVCCLLQLESQMGGDYSQPLAETHYGSPSSHTIMSFFTDVELTVMTVLAGERHPKRPIHKPEFFKEILPESLEAVIQRVAGLLGPFV